MNISRQQMSKKNKTHKSSISTSTRHKSTIRKNSHWPTDIFIIDENGNDVTVKPLYQLDDFTRKRQAGFNDSSESPTDGFSQASFFMTGLGSTHQFSRSVFHKSSMETSELPEDLFQVFDSPEGDKLMDQGPIFPAKDIEDHTDKDDFEVKLTMTELFDFIDMPATVVSNSDERIESIKALSRRYEKVLKNRIENDDCFEDKGINTFNNALKLKGTQTTPIILQDKENMATDWDIYDQFNPDEEVEEVPERKLSKISLDDEKTSHGSEYDSHMSESVGMETQTDVFSKSMTSAFSSLSTWVKNESQYIDIDAFNKCSRVIETYLSLNNHQSELSRYRGLPDLTNTSPEDQKRTLSNLTISKSTLRKLWKYSEAEASELSVTSMAINQENKDLLAVGYGKHFYGNSSGGLVCCWSVKNTIHPGRKYQQTCGVTAVSFSRENPNLLAVGLIDGSIFIYNVRSPANEPIASNEKTITRHHGPIWGLEWVIKSTMDGEVSEMIISTSSDGRIIQWNMKKGLEGYDIMRLKKAPERLKHIEPGGLMRKMSKTNYILYRNSECYCLEFSTTDPNIYYAGTNEGHIYKCSCSYNEHHIANYRGHTAPVYKIRISPVVPDAFISAGADWKMNLWMSDMPNHILQLSRGTEEILDVSWCPWNSAIFASVRETFVELWDLNVSTTEPFFALRAINSEKFTTVRFSSNSKCVFVGDSVGTVGVYELINSEEENVEGNKLIKIINQLIKNEETKD